MSVSRHINQKYFSRIYLYAQVNHILNLKFTDKFETDQFSSNPEPYNMDNKILQYLIQDIVETGEYTLEGIAYHTRIPFDVIYDAACGINAQISITPWIKIIELYLGLKPEIKSALLQKIMEDQIEYDLVSSW